VEVKPSRLVLGQAIAFLVKKAVEQLCSQYGEIKVFSMENGVYIF
jgi:hypothetical protein